jgi:hypothetical protein
MKDRPQIFILNVIIFILGIFLIFFSYKYHVAQSRIDDVCSLAADSKKLVGNGWYDQFDHYESLKVACEVASEGR